MRAVLLGFLLLLGLAGAAPAQTQSPAAVNGCIYYSSLPTLVNGQRNSFLCDVNGKLLVSSSGGGGVPTSLPVGIPITGCATSGGILYNDASSNIACASGVTTTGTALSASGGTLTASAPAFSSLQTWNNAAVAFQGVSFDTVLTTLSASSNLLRLRSGLSFGALADVFTVRYDGLTTAPSFVVSTAFAASIGGGVNGVNLGSAYCYGITAAAAFATADTVMCRKAAATWQFGNADAAAPVAQTIGVQSVVAGTSNTAGANWTLRGSVSTGSGVSGDVIVQTGGTGAGATVQNALTAALTIKGGAVKAVRSSATLGTGGYTVSTLPAAVAGDRAYVTDQLTACAVTGAALTGGGAVVCPAFYNGSAWVGG